MVQESFFLPGFNHLGGQKAPQKEAKMVPNQAREAARAQHGETSTFTGLLAKSDDFSGPGTFPGR